MRGTLRCRKYFDRDGVWEVIAVDAEPQEHAILFDSKTGERTEGPVLFEYKAICADGDRELTFWMGVYYFNHQPLSPGDRFRFAEDPSGEDTSEGAITLPNGAKIIRVSPLKESAKD